MQHDVLVHNSSVLSPGCERSLMLCTRGSTATLHLAAYEKGAVVKLRRVVVTVRLGYALLHDGLRYDTVLRGAMESLASQCLSGSWLSLRLSADPATCTAPTLRLMDQYAGSSFHLAFCFLRFHLYQLIILAYPHRLLAARSELCTRAAYIGILPNIPLQLANSRSDSWLVRKVLLELHD